MLGVKMKNIPFSSRITIHFLLLAYLAPLLSIPVGPPYDDSFGSDDPIVRTTGTIWHRTTGTILHESAFSANKGRILEILKNSPNIDINARDLDNKTALDIALEKGYCDTATVLFAAGAQRTSTIRLSGRLQNAEEKGIAIFNNIIESFQKGHENAIDYLRECVKLGYSLGTRDSDKHNALHYAVKSDKPALARFLFAYAPGWLHEKNSSSGHTPLHLLFMLSRTKDQRWTNFISQLPANDVQNVQRAYERWLQMKEHRAAVTMAEMAHAAIDPKQTDAMQVDAVEAEVVHVDVMDVDAVQAEFAAVQAEVIHPRVMQAEVLL